MIDELTNDTAHCCAWCMQYVEQALTSNVHLLREPKDKMARPSFTITLTIPYEELLIKRENLNSFWAVI